MALSDGKNIERDYIRLSKVHPSIGSRHLDSAYFNLYTFSCERVWRLEKRGLYGPLHQKKVVGHHLFPETGETFN